jgi:mannose-6-phosphate isomerase-like protein (cupin superfamily)
VQRNYFSRALEWDMKHIRTGKRLRFFEVLASSRVAQVAMMVLARGQSSGELSNEHPRCEQWLFVISGSGSVLTGERRVSIRKNSLVQIEKRERHQVRNTGRRPLVTLNFYAPPAYTSDGHLRPNAARRR